MDNKKSYLCIGGPLHGRARAIEGRTLRVPTFNPERVWVGVETHVCIPPAYTDTRYDVKEIELHEQRTEPSTGDAMDVTVRVSARVRLLAHESILTTEELSAHFRKLRPNAILGGVSHVTRHMELLKASVWRS